MSEREKGEIISLHIGQAGIQLAKPLWKLLCLEHEISLDGGENTSSVLDRASNCKSFFVEKAENRYEPRTIFADCGNEAFLDPLPIFNQGSFYSGSAQSDGNFAKVRSLDVEELKNKIRLQTEQCDYLEGFLFYQSTTGGAGSGLTSSLLQSLKDEFPSRNRVVFSLFPPPTLSESFSGSSFFDPGRTLAPYNHLMSINSFVHNSECTFCYDNLALQKVFRNSVNDNLIPIHFPELNEVWAYNIGSVTSILRRKSAYESDLSFFISKRVPYSTLQFLFSSSAPYRNIELSCQQTLSCAELTARLFSSDNFFYSCSLHPFVHPSMHFHFSVYYRGDVTSRDARTEYLQVIRKPEFKFAAWATSSCGYYAESGLRRECFRDGHFQLEQAEACATINNSCINGNFIQFQSQMTAMVFQRKYFHYYEQEGMEENEILGAMETLNQVTEDYNEASVDDDEEDVAGGVGEGEVH
jgi:tubulin alpha